MNILQINTTVNTGSTGRIAEGIGRQLMKAEHQSTIAYGRQENPSASATIRIGNKWSVYTHGLKSLLLDRHGFGSRKATKDLIAKIEKVQPDVIGLHNLHGYYLNVEVLFQALQQWAIPVIWTFHDCWPFTGHCTYYDSVGCEKWKSHCHHCPKTGKYPKSILLDNSRSNFSDKERLFTSLDNLTIVTPSNWLANDVKQSFLKTYPVKVIHNGIDLSIFKPQSKKSYAATNIVLGVASTWDARKGLKDFIRIREALPDNYQIVLIGLSKKQVHQLPKGIEGIERTENTAELAKWYGCAAVFVNPTYQDNFPTTNIEALACGTPVVTYNTGGSPEAIDDNTGRVVEKGDIQGLVTAIQALAAQDQQTLSNACRQRAERHFNQEDRYQEYVALYESLVREGNHKER